MGRIGVTFVDIENAILQLQGRGKAPTVDNIRELLGTGSKSTIIQHLKMWKSKNQESQGKLPNELLSLVTGLWERLNQEADQRITNIETTHNQRSEELKQALYQSQREHHDLKNRFHEIEELFHKEKHSNSTLSQKIQHDEQEFVKLNERYQAAILQINEHKTENTKLHQLATNIQANLEHYQQAVQQARNEQHLLMENLQIQFKQERNELQNELLNYQKQSQELLQKLHEANVSLKHLQEQYDLLYKQHTELSQSHQSNRNDLIIYKDRNEQNQKQIETLQNNLQEKLFQWNQLEKDYAVIKDQADQLQKTLLNTHDKIETLRQEKIFLIQEKSDLLGQLKYFQEKSSKKSAEPA